MSTNSRLRVAPRKAVFRLFRHGLLFAGVAAWLAGCSLFPREAKVPMPTLGTKSSSTKPATTLIVFLPGRNGRIDDFERHGFITELQRAGVNADTLTADAHLGYYYKRTIMDRLRDDVFTPSRARGYRRIVVVGISLGGLGALLSARDLPGSADAVVLLSPFLGDRKTLFEQIGSAGGPSLWAKGRELRSGDVGEEIWTFLGQRGTQLPPTWLYFGQADSLSRGQNLLASMLPASQVEIVDGGHDWKTWQKLWRDVCASPDIFREEKTQAR